MVASTYSLMCLLASAEAYVLAPTGPRSTMRTATPEMSLVSPFGMGAVAAGVTGVVVAVRSHGL